jgi:hypothetical protein
MKIWVIKQFIMIRKLIPAVIILLVFCCLPFHSSAASNERTNHTIITSEDMKIIIPDQAAGKGSPLHPGGQDVPHLPKAKPPHMEELPHIHRFHKERVKKISQHHGGWWLISQVIIVLCHLSILVIAWMHVTH